MFANLTPDGSHSAQELDLIKYSLLSEVPLRQHMRRNILRRPNSHIAAVTKPIWSLITEHLTANLCIYQKHKTLHSLSLTCRFLNEAATKALYQTLDLEFPGKRDLDPSGCSCSIHKKLAIDSSKPRKRHPLRNKLNRLIRTLRTRPGIVSHVLNLKLPYEHVLPKLIEQPSEHEGNRSAGDSVNPIFLKWFEIFRLCSPGLHSVSGLGTLLREFQSRGFLRLETGNELWQAMEDNKQWRQWDFTGWNSTFLPGLDTFGFPPADSSHNFGWSLERLQQAFSTWKHLEHITLEETAWLQGALHFLPNLESITINGNGYTDFNNIFPYIPAQNLKSLSYNCLELKAEERRLTQGPEYLKSEPFGPLVKFLEATKSSSTPSKLTKIDINFQWWNDEHKPYDSMMCTFKQLASSIFSSASLLEELNVKIATFHEHKIGDEDIDDLAQDLEQHSLGSNANVLAQHLQAMSISVPAQTNKEWLARKISSGAFPSLTTLNFRSSLSKGQHGVCTRCTDIENPKALRDWAKAQDERLVNACQDSGIDRWVMRIRDNPENVRRTLEYWLFYPTIDVAN